jgi:hypothetical protein
MRVTYSLSYESYLNLQPPFRANGPVGSGMFYVLYFAALVTGAGVALLCGQAFAAVGGTQDAAPGWSTSAAVFAVGAFALASAWGVRKLSARSAAKENAEFLRESYGRLHCRDQRFIETTKEGVIFGCGCDSQTDAWSQLFCWAETDRDFTLWTRRNLASIPKEAFGREAERTEFRATLAERAGESQMEMSRAVEFTVNAEDEWHAKLLLFRQAGWKRKGLLTLLAIFLGSAIVFHLPFVGAGEAWTVPHVVGAFGAMLGAAFWLDHLRRGWSVDKIHLKVWFAEDGIYVRSDQFTLRIPWGFVLWCTADSNILLFCYRPGGLLLIPMRAIPPAQMGHVMQAIIERLPPYA